MILCCGDANQSGDLLRFGKIGVSVTFIMASSSKVRAEYDAIYRQYDEANQKLAQAARDGKLAYCARVVAKRAAAQRAASIAKAVIAARCRWRPPKVGYEWWTYTKACNQASVDAS